MANSKLTVNFYGDFTTTEFNIKFNTTLEGVLIEKNFVFRPIRSAPYQVTIPTPNANIDIPGVKTAINFAAAFQLDLGNLYNVTRVGNQVVIESTSQDEAFNLFYAYKIIRLPNKESEEQEVLFYDAVIENKPSDSFKFITTELSKADNPCINARITVTTNVLATKVLSPYYLEENTHNPIVMEALRGSVAIVKLENVNGTQITKSVQMPDILNGDNFSVIVNNGPNGATVFAQNNLNGTFGLTFEYSLDGSNFQTNNKFIGIAVGDYSITVRDNFGCSFSKKFKVDEFGIQSPYFYISKANSIRYANRITWGDSGNYKNDENTLSCEVDVQLAYKEFQQFQSADIITTQFKSNYSSNSAKIIKEDGSEIDIPIVKKTNNIGIKDKRDARKYNLGNGKTGLYFLSGNKYDYNTNAVTDSYSLNGLLPEWAIVGNYFEIVGSWYLIEGIVFDEEKNAEIIVFSNTYSGPEINEIVGSIYNLFEYEVYEYSIDMVDYIDKKFRVKLVNSHPNFITIIHLSEVIWCKVKHENVIEIRYRNTTNTDIMYSTGIEHKIRIPYLKVSGKSDEQSEVHKTDTDAILLNADLYEVDDFQFEPVTKEIWRKMMIALSHEKVFLNGVGYVKNGSFNTEGPLERSNLYVLTASMIKTANVYNSQTSGNNEFSGSDAEVPGLISTHNGYLRY